MNSKFTVDKEISRVLTYYHTKKQSMTGHIH